MALRAKFNMAIITALVIGYAGAGALLHRLFVANAKAAVLENARVMMAAANAVQAYTDKQVVPLTGLEQNGTFLASSVPFYAATATFRRVQAAFPAYALAETALNPTNAEDRPSDWQADLIHEFRNHPQRRELVDLRNTPTGKVLDLAQPVAVSDPSCLACHSSPSIAPASLLRAYGSNNGFGWKLHEIVGAQIVSVPFALALGKANSAFVTFMGSLAGIFVVVLIVLNLLLEFAVIRPVVKVATLADAVSLGKPGIEVWQHAGRDEIGVLSVAFNRMRRSLDAALKLLDTPWPTRILLPSAATG